MSTLSLPLVRAAQRLLAPARALDRHTVLVGGALAVVYLVWGSTYLAIEVAIMAVPPLTMLAARFAVAGAVLLVWARWRGVWRPGTLTLHRWGQAAVGGASLLVAGTGMTALAQTRITSGTAALLAATVPIWMALFARGVFGERLTRRAWAGLLVGLVGIAVLVDPSGGGDLVGMLLVLGGAVGWAAGSLRSRVVAAPAPPLVAAGMEMVAAAPLFALLGVVLGEPGRLELAAIDATTVGAFAYLVIAGALLAFSAYRWLLANASTTLVGTYAYVNPVVAVTLGWAVLGEPVHARTALAGAVVLVAVALTVTGRPGEPVPAQPTSGADVFVGESRWHRARQRLGRLPGVARLFVEPRAPQYRDVGYEQPIELAPEDARP